MGRLFWFGLAFVFGVGAASIWQPEVSFLYLMLFLGFVVSSLSRRWGELSLIMMVFCLGSIRVASINIEPLPKEGHLSGRVVFSSGRTAIVENQNHRLEGDFYPKSPALGELVVVWYQGYPRISQIDGEVQNDGIVARNRVVKRKIRSWSLVHSPPPISKPNGLELLKYGEILWTFISGDKAGISGETKSLMRETGTSHLLAISGLHIGLISGLVYWLLRIGLSPLFLIGWERTALKLPIVVAVCFAYLYGQKVGWPPSAQRAVIMVAIFSMGKFFEISISLGDCLGVAAMAVLYREPAELYSLSFQLSFAAVLGIAIFLPVFRKYTLGHWHPLTRKIILSLGVTTGATLGTLPLVGWYFQEFAWVGWFSNLLVMPLMASIAVPLALLSSLLPEGFSLFLLCFADAAIELSMSILLLLRGNPLELAFTAFEAVLCAIAILLMRWRLWAGVLVFFLYSAAWEDNPNFEVQFLAIGQGDSAVIRWGDRRVWLVDGGGFSVGLLRYLRREKIYAIDRIVISHPHPDHFGGLFPVLEKIRVETLVVARFPEKDEKKYAELLELAHEKNINITLAKDWSEKNMTLFHPLDWKAQGQNRVNEESIVFTIQNGQHRFLFTGDIEEEAEQHLENEIGQVDVLKVAHHGSRSSSSSGFIQNIRPRFSVISCGINNRFGHPHTEAISRLSSSSILRTDRLGTITFRSDGTVLSWEATNIR